MKWEIEGTEPLLRTLENMMLDFKNELAEGVWLELSSVMNKSKKECPVDTGRLRASGYVFDPMISFDEIICQLGYATEYAIYVHENLEARHDPPTKAKFLEDPLVQAMPTMIPNMVARARKLIEVS